MLETESYKQVKREQIFRLMTFNAAVMGKKTILDEKHHQQQQKQSFTSCESTRLTK